MSVSLEILNNNNSYRTTTAATAKSVKAAESKSVSIPVEENAEKSVPNVDSFVHGGGSAKYGAYSKTMAMRDNKNFTIAVKSRNSTDTARVPKNIPYSLAAKRAGISRDMNGMPRISGSSDYNAFQTQLNKIKNDNYRKMYVNSSWKYSQTGTNNYGYDNAGGSCATFALATALSIREGYKITPDKITTNSSSDGQGTVFSNHGAYTFRCTEDEARLGIDAQLALGHPALIHTSGKDKNNKPSEHWATVIGKENGNYRIIDPWDGTERDLSQMEIYKKGGSIIGYGIVSDQY